MIYKNGLDIGNVDRATHHWTREGHEGESVIDLTQANRPMRKWSILTDDHTTGSNHEVRKREVEADRQEEAEHERIVQWNLAPMTEEVVEAAEKI